MIGVYITMKYNDYNFIKDKFDKSEYEVPLSLDTSVIKEEIILLNDSKKIKHVKSSWVLKLLSSAAACLILVLSIFCLSNSFISGQIKPFNNYDDLSTKISTLETVTKADEMGCENFSTIIYRREDGVEVPNIVKAYNGYIYYGYYNSNDNNNRNKIYIFRAENKNTKLASIIDGFNLDEYEIQDLFAIQNRLIVNLSSGTSVVTKIYDISDSSKPSFITEFEQSGKYSASNIIDETLYIVTEYSAENNIPYIKQNNKKIFTSIKNIVCFENAQTAQYAVINTINIKTGNQASDLKAVLGGSAKIHCTKKYMYINEYINGENVGVPERKVTTAMKLNLYNGKISYATEKEVKKYSNYIIDIGKGEMYSSVLYPVGENFLSIGEDVNKAENEIILFDNNMNLLDSITFNDTFIITNSGFLAENNEKNIYAVPAYFADETMRHYGVVTFEIKDSKIVIKNKFINNDSDLMYQGMCIFIDDYIYSFNINDNAPDNSKVKIFAYEC